MKFKERIAIFNTQAVAITMALVFMIIYFVVHKTAYNHIDADILLEKEEVFKNLNCINDSIIIAKLPEWDESEHNKVEVDPTFLQIVDQKDRVIFHSSNLLKNQFLFNPNNKQVTFYNSEISNQKIRLGQFPVKNKEDKIIGQLTIAVSQKESLVILNNLVLVLLISFPIMLIIQYVTSYFAASKAIKPVNQLINTASKINDSNIETRLVLPQNKDELYQLTITINELLSRIEKSMLQQKQFTSDASHEIRTPLSAIRGTLEVLIRKQREPEVYKTKITDVISQVDRLDILLDQLLQIARIESGIIKEKTENLNLLQFISILEKKWKQQSIKKQIKIHIQISDVAIITGDKLFLELIFENIVLNAIKYGKDKGNIFISWDDSIKTLSIKDDGIGISEVHLPNIFNRFYRTDESRSSLIQGNGLGLSIVKKLADLQQINISVKSDINIGTTFLLEFTR